MLISKYTLKSQALGDSAVLGESVLIDIPLIRIPIEQQQANLSTMRGKIVEDYRLFSKVLEQVRKELLAMDAAATLESGV